MKTIFTITMLAVAASICAQEVELSVSSRIDQVTVFLQGAQVVRHADVALKRGVSVLKFEAIAPGIQDQSIQVEGPEGVKILSVSYQVNYLDQIKKPEKIQSLKTEQARLQDLLAQEKSMMEVYREEEAILMTNKSIGGESKGVDINDLKVAMDYFRQRLTDIKQQLLKGDRTMKEFQISLSRIEAQLAALQISKAQPTAEILVKASTQKNGNASFTIKYVVRQAKWFPTYDIRAKDVLSPIGITYKANINQQSGEDWTNVNLTISSGNPSAGGSSPIIKPWYLGYNNSVAERFTDSPYGNGNNIVHGRITDTDKLGIPGANIVIKGTTVGTVSDIEGNYTLPLTADAQVLVVSFIGYQTMEIPINGKAEINSQLIADVQSLQEVVATGFGFDGAAYSGRLMGVTSPPRVKRTLVATPVVRQTNIEYTLDELFTVKSDGEVRSTEMMEYELDALFEYYCVPKLEVDAFLTAKVLNWDEYNFLEGEASLYFEGKYIGKSILDTRITSDTLILSLGRDANVMVKRERIKEFSTRQLVGSNQKATMAYEISIRNKKSQPIAIVIVDQLPVSTSKDISIDNQEDSNADYNKDTGILKWRREIQAGNTEVISLKYAVRYPKSNNIYLE